MQDAKETLAAIIETPFNMGSDLVHPQSPGLVVREDSCGYQRALDLQEKASELTTEASLFKGPTMARLLSALTLREACGEQMTYQVNDHVDLDILVPEFRIPCKMRRAKRKEAISSEQIEPTRRGQTDDQGRDLAPCSTS